MVAMVARFWAQPATIIPQARTVKMDIFDMGNSFDGTGQQLLAKCATVSLYGRLTHGRISDFMEDFGTAASEYVTRYGLTELFCRGGFASALGLNNSLP